MSMQAQFDDTEIYFIPAEIKPFDMARLQAGMFMDRPDLWRKPNKKTPYCNPAQIRLEINIESNSEVELKEKCA